MVTYTGFAKGNRVTRINEREMARMFYAAGDVGHVLTRSSFTLSALGGNRRVQLSGGTLSACGVNVLREGITDAVTIDIPLPAAGRGQDFLVVARFNWTTGEVSYVPIASTTTGQLTADKMPPRPPLAYPALNRSPGEIYDVPLGWVWASYGFTAMRVVNLGVLPDGTPASATAATEKYAERTGINPISAGTTGEAAGGKWDLPRGLYEVTGSAVVGTTAAGATSTGEVALVVNGSDPATRRTRFDPEFAGRPAALTATVDHPGGEMSVSVQFRGGNATVNALPTSFVSARWLRNVLPAGAAA